MNWTDHVESSLDVLAGKPRIKGTRLTVEFLLGRLADGWTNDEILENYPQLSNNDLRAVRDYQLKLDDIK